LLSWRGCRICIRPRFFNICKDCCSKHKEMAYFQYSCFDFCGKKALLLSNLLSYSRIYIPPPLFFPAIWVASLLPPPPTRPLFVSIHVQDSLTISRNVPYKEI
jgi:hypothetical protein